MDELLSVLQALPPPALMVFAAVVALIFGARYLGLLQGIKGPPSPESKAQVVAMVVDPTALNAAAGEVAGLAVTITEAMAVVRAHTAAVDRQADRIDQLADGVDKLRDQLVYVAAKLG